MQFERIVPVSSGDPLRYTGEVDDPLFDPEEIEVPLLRRRRKPASAAAILGSGAEAAG